MMKNLIYKVAKKIVEKHDNLIKQKELKELKEKEEKRQIYEKQKLFDDTIREFKKQFIDIKVEEFKANSTPKFSVGETVTTHWYSYGDSWEGSIKMLQNHTPYKGPTDVIITSVHIDYSELGDLIDLLSFTEGISYNDFQKIVDLRLRNRNLCIHWAYNIKVPNDENNYWHYTLRENKFLKLNSDEAKWSKEAYIKEQEIDKLTKEKNDLINKLTAEKIELINKIADL